MRQWLLKIFQICFVGLIFSCSANKQNLEDSKIIYIYNPSQDIKTVKIDNKEVKLPPMDALPHQLSHGMHLLEFEELKDSFLVDTGSNLVINSLRDTLLSVELLYVPNGEKIINENDYSRKFMKLKIEDLMYYGPFVLTNDLYIRDWAYGPGHPVNMQITERSYVKPDNDSLFSAIKIYSIPEFVENYISINHTEEYIKEMLPRYLSMLSNDVIVEIKGDELYAGTKNNKYGLADIHVLPDEKLYLRCWEIYDPQIHGTKQEIKFTINDCTVEFNEKITKGREIHGLSVSKSDFIVLEIK